ncbi:MAG: hypothetical protein ACHQ53_02925 [Polyangiales bacterium]
MPLPELRMSFADRAGLEREIATNLRHGRAFVMGATGVEVLADCVLVLVHPDHAGLLELPGQAVLVSDSDSMRGVGVELRPFDASVVSTLEEFARGEICVPEPAAEAEAEATLEPDAVAVDGAEEGSVEDAAATADDATPSDEANLSAAEGQDPSDVQALPARQERFRKLNVTQQQKIARTGELNDRVMLERIYGKGVWDGLLHNPKLTLPEVARIARKGTIPRPMLELIVDNNAWIQAPIVRRALLGNPRISGEGIMKLLRITPKHELKSIYKTTTYSSQVREAARKVLDL